MSPETAADLAGQIFLYYCSAWEYALAQGMQSIGAFGTKNISTSEDVMKMRVILLCVALAAPAFSAMPAVAQDAAGKTAMGKEAKWQGHVVRIDKDHSMIDIHGGPSPSKESRKVAYDSSTEWTNMGKPAQMEDVKEGSFVILLGHVDHKGVLHATRVDLRLPRS
ncbi:MAG TPA: hypothetical protein VGS05_08855 [Candidatus Sulfotelmatobacter sp.]|nr:hypothetical protein [Candidatus Sulfotelmatobacter sp.]